MTAAANTDHTADSPANWAEVARHKYAHYKSLCDNYEASVNVSEIAIHVHERSLAGMAPHLADAIDRNRDIGYVTGVYAAAQWLASIELRRGYDQDTWRQIRAGLDAMTLAAIGRLGVNPDGCESRDWGAADRVALEQPRRNEQIRIDGGSR
jgi:hypothetical protein